jgi:DeoR family transcriptional regulator, suf operon transcriptional repressor
MDAAALGRRFLDSTRGRIVALLRRSASTVEELAAALGLTDNAVRNHLSALERDGIVRPEGVRRSGGAGKPAVVYDLHPDAAPLLSRAYPPMLASLIAVLAERLPDEQAAGLLREAGRRIAREAGGQAQGDLDARVRAAAAMLTALGGDIEIVREERGHRLRSTGCPISAAVSHRPEACAAIESFVAEVTGATARTCCERGARPRCCFVVEPAAA